MSQLTSFHIAGTKSTPEVHFEESDQKIVLSGVSSPENTAEFYRPVFELVEKTSVGENAAIQVDMKLVHFNSSSAKVLFDLLQKLENDFQKSNVQVDWYCDEDDDDMIEAAEDFYDILDINISIIINEEV